MGCEGCGTKGKAPSGCGNNGHCESGGCSRLEVYDWLSEVAAPAFDEHDVYEISFKNGARKEFFRNNNRLDISTGDYVMVETPNVGYDIGRVSMGGELVKLQMRKKLRNKREAEDLRAIIRIAREREMQKLTEARSREKETMLRARVIARSLGLDMKLGDVEFQADLRKATFFYTADGRVDFRELIKELAQEFRVKIEMRQIGARQEAGRVGGIGACGRELCCSSWLTNFKSVNTSAARYQNLSINQTKLSGQCGRLKCCLNYELDTYLDALRSFPDEDKARRITTVKGDAFLVKTDILKGLMTYQYRDGNEYYPIPIDDVKEILELNEAGKKAGDLGDMAIVTDDKEGLEFEDVVGQITLKTLEQADRKKRGNRNKKKSRSGKSKPSNRGGNDGDRRGSNRGNKSNRERSGDRPVSSEGRDPSSQQSRSRNKRRRPPRKGGNQDSGGSQKQ